MEGYAFCDLSCAAASWGSAIARRMRKGVAMRVSMHRRLLPGILVLSLLFAIVPVVPAMAIGEPKTVYVDAVNGSDATGDGTNGNPYMSITAGLRVALSGDTVIVAPGTYSASTTGELFPLRVYASDFTFAGSGPADCIIDAESLAGVMEINSVTGVMISGFTITGGLTSGSGGGVYGILSEFNLEDCDIRDNDAMSGAGIRGDSSDITMLGCQVLGNGESSVEADSLASVSVEADSVAGCYEGGGIYTYGGTLDLRECGIGDNSVSEAGAGIRLMGTQATITDSSLYGNTIGGPVAPNGSTWAGIEPLQPAGLGGGAVSAADSVVDIADCGFWSNGAPYGSSVLSAGSDVEIVDSWFGGDTVGDGVVAGMAGAPIMGTDGAVGTAELPPVVEPFLDVENSYFEGSTGESIFFAESMNGLLRNCVFTDNEAGFPLLAFIDADWDVMNTTIAGNMSGMPAVYAQPFGVGSIEPTPLMPGVRLTNSIVWDENAEEMSVEAVDVTYSDLRYMEDMVPLAVDETVISEDPDFVDLGDGDLSLLAGSPCIDTGIDAVLAPDVDIDGNSRPVDGDNSGTAEWDMGAYEFSNAVTDGRIEGSDRYETAVEISQDHFDSADTAVLATGRIFPDGLSASGLAGAYNAPVLLTAPDALPAVVAQELVRLGVSHVIICGDGRAISSGVANAVAALGDIDVERIGGRDRYETATMMADEIVAVTGEDPALVFVARGDTFPDALAVSPIAWSRSAPVLLVRPGELPRYTIDYFIDTLAGTKTRTVIVGGEAAVSSGVQSMIAALGVALDDRISGADRYETACEVALWADDMGFATFGVTGVATGETFADALTGGPGIGASGGVLLLNPRATANPMVCDTISDHAADISVLQIFGSSAAITDEVATILNDCRNIER